MKKYLLVLLSVTMVAIAPNIAGPLHAQDIEISSPSLEWTYNNTWPSDWETIYDYGNVAIVESKTGTFILSNVGLSTSVWVYVLALAEVDGDFDVTTGSVALPPASPPYETPEGVPYPNHVGAFSFNPGVTLDQLPWILDDRESVSIDIIFSPTSQGSQSV